MMFSAVCFMAKPQLDHQSWITNIGSLMEGFALKIPVLESALRSPAAQDELTLKSVCFE